ncbi:hypothetical protein [Nitriliruptor alkaliphilus]|uniref:hypothetical protein n=1 Tax=Nitriliruptor alkaliphilus TaxID=427918 RepID=UPI00069744F0|nr:hypothetical protein [Nitriliruptor alkaliphilus]
MTHRCLSRLLACTLAALLLAGCGSQAPVQLDVAPAATTGDAPAGDAPAGDAPAGDAPAAEAPGVEDPVAPDETDPADPVTGAEQPPAETSAQPSPPDPELVVDEDGCATDVATGIVVACHDPAAGPDDE